MFTFNDKESIRVLRNAQAEEPQNRLAQKDLARAMTTMVHGEDATDAVERASRVIFDKKIDPSAIDDEIYEMLAAEIPSVSMMKVAELDVLGVLERAFQLSRGAGRKLLQQGGITVNGEKLAADALTVPRAKAVRGRWFLVRKGARDIALADVG
jgi:tyrosyl-tRNA synthetase